MDTVLSNIRHLKTITGIANTYIFNSFAKPVQKETMNFL